MSTALSPVIGRWLYFSEDLFMIPTFRISLITQIGVFLRNSKTIPLVLVFVLMLFLGFFRLETVPPLWWDEGWTLQVARNWVELGHYGRIIDGQPSSSRLSASFPIVTPVAASFQMFGVGVWQGRLPGVLISLVTLAILYSLASRLYSRRIAAGALAVLFFMSVSPQVHVLLISRQVLAEMHSHFYLLVGFTLFYAALRNSAWLLVPAVLVWGLALISKAQVPPFFYASLVVPLALALLKGWRRTSLMLVVALIGSWSASYLYRRLIGILLTGITVSGDPIVGLHQLLAFVPVYEVRLTAIRAGLIVGLPTLMGLVFALVELSRMVRRKDADEIRVILRLALISLAGSWFIWYLFLGNFFGRYLFPPLFFGSVFTSAFIYRLSGGFSLPYLVKNASAVITNLKFKRESIGALFTLLLLSVAVPLSLLALYQAYNPTVKSTALEVAAYFDEHIEPGMLIETYESELLFLSDHHFHIPPDQVFVDVERRKSVDPQHPVDYNPLDADPDYLVVGIYSYGWGLYDEVISSPEFNLIKAFPRYHIYQRVR
jgi:4-amino-4-deoxy-L-arabinose transferase-like glycosyltransferase